MFSSFLRTVLHTLQIQSINQSIYLYSASSRYLLRGAPEPGLIKKESLEVLVKRSRGDTRGGSEVKRKIIPNFQRVGPATEKDLDLVLAVRANGTRKSPQEAERKDLLARVP